MTDCGNWISSEEWEHVFVVKRLTYVIAGMVTETLALWDCFPRQDKWKAYESSTRDEWTWALYSTVCQTPRAPAGIPTACSLTTEEHYKETCSWEREPDQAVSLSRTVPFSGECWLVGSGSPRILPHWDTLKTPRTSSQDKPSALADVLQESRWHITELCSTIRNEVMPFIEKWIELEIILSSKLN